MKRPDLVLHALVAVAWISLALAIALKVALLGNEQAALAKQRGADFKARTDLAYKQERLRAVLDQAASPTALEDSARRIELPLAPPEPTAARDRAAAAPLAVR